MSTHELHTESDNLPEQKGWTEGQATPTVTVWDDEHMIGDVLTALLAELGYNARFFSTVGMTVEQVAERVVANPADVVVLDGQYPEGKTAEDIIRMVGPAQQQFVVSSGRSYIGEAVRRTYPNVAVLDKPFGFEDVVRVFEPLRAAK